MDNTFTKAELIRVLKIAEANNEFERVNELEFKLSRERFPRVFNNYCDHMTTMASVATRCSVDEAIIDIHREDVATNSAIYDLALENDYNSDYISYLQASALKLAGNA